MPTRLLHPLMLVGCVVLIACLVAPSRAQEKKKDPAEVMKALEQMLNDYRDENASLKARVKELEGEVQNLKQNRVINVVPQQPAATGQVPPSWKPFQFNGATYYVVPLAGGQAQNAGDIWTQAQLPPTAGEPAAKPAVVLPASKK